MNIGYNGFVRIVLDIKNNPTYTGALVGAEVTLPIPSRITKITVFSLYGLLESIGKVGYSIPTLHRMLSDLTPILETEKRERYIIIGGDFNADVQLDKGRHHSHKIFFSRLEDFGLVNCHPERQQTFFRKKTAPYQDDYIFVSENIKNYLKKDTGDVPKDDEALKHSDHKPVVVELNI